MGVLRRPEPIPPCFVSFAWRYRDCARCFAPTGCRRPLPVDLDSLVTRCPTRDWIAEISGFSQVPGRTLLCTCPGLIHPGGPSMPGHSAPRILPSASATTSAPRSRSLEADYHGLHTRCLRFAARGYPNATQDSLPVGGQPLSGRIRTYRVHYEGFQVLSTAFSFLPSQAWPGARHFSGNDSSRRLTSATYRALDGGGRWTPIAKRLRSFASGF
jgi:hypothetical protein